MIYTCPMHPEIEQEGPVSCPICGMDLVPKSKAQKQSNHATDGSKGFFVTYKPLLIIVGLIALTAATLTWRDIQVGLFDGTATMQYIMAGFFLVFSGLKLLDVGGFAKGYATYDLLATRVKAYGYVYPFIELALGLMYLVGYITSITLIFTAVLMIFSGIGVAIKVAKRERFQCACLGTLIKVPLTKVTLIEDFGMAAMAVAMLLMM